MTVGFFQLPDDLVGAVPQSAAFGQNTQMANRVLGNAQPSVPRTNGTLDAAQIALIISSIDNHYGNAISTATAWESGSVSVKDYVATVLTEFARFSEHMTLGYPNLLSAAYNKDEAQIKDELKRIVSIVAEVRARTNGAVTAVNNYESNLAADQKDFNADFEKVLSEVGDVSAVITNLKSATDSLQADVHANNQAVLNTAIDTAGTELEQGVTLFSSAATDNAGGAVSAGVQMGVAYAKGITKIIELNQKTVDDLEKIRKIGLQVDQDDQILAILVNVGTTLSALGSTRGVKLSLVDAIESYWSALETGIEGLLSGSGTIGNQIDLINYSPTTVGFHNPDFPPWDVVVPLQRAATAFTTVMDLAQAPAQVFGDDTEFAALA